MCSPVVSTYVREVSDGGNDIRTLVHDDNITRAQAGLSILEGVKVHPFKNPTISGNDVK